MKWRSDKRRAEASTAEAEREAFALEFPQCMVPGCRRQSCDVHEIARGPARRAAYLERCAWLSLCRICHDAMDDYSVWPLDRQYALKALRDTAFYDRQRLNELRGRAPDAISEQEVIVSLLRLVA